MPWTNWACVCAIGIYQRRISPIKGYRCAHDVWFGSGGCSGYALQALKELPLGDALRATLRRLHFCRNIALAMSSPTLDPGSDREDTRGNDVPNTPVVIDPAAKRCLGQIAGQGVGCCLPAIFW